MEMCVTCLSHLVEASSCILFSHLINIEGFWAASLDSWWWAAGLGQLCGPEPGPHLLKPTHTPGCGLPQALAVGGWVDPAWCVHSHAARSPSSFTLAH